MEDCTREVLQSQYWKNHMSLLLEFHWLDNNYIAAPDFKGNWEMLSTVFPQNKT